MREYGFQINVAGLKTDASALDGMTMLKNLKPDGDHWTVPDAFTMPLDVEAFPFPQLIRTSKYLLCGGADYLNVLDPVTLEPVDEYATEEGGLWQVADLGELFVATNGTCTVSRLRVYEDEEYSLETTVSEAKQWGACCDYRRARLIVGDLGAGYENWVAWGAIGADDLTAMVSGGTVEDRVKLRNERMAVLMPFSGAIVAIRELDRFLIVYGTDGVAALRQHDVTGWHGYAFETLGTPAGVGAAHRGAVAGDMNGHVFIGSDGNVYSIAPDLGVKRICDGTFVPETAAVSHDAAEREFWFSSATSAYVLTESGVGGPIDTAPWSIVRLNGERIATGYQYPADLRAQLWTNILDAGDSSQKRISLIRAAGDGMTAVKAALKYAYTTGTAPVQSAWRNGAPDGSVFINIAVGSFHAGVLAAVAPGSRLWRVEVRYQSHDRRFIRGTRGLPKEES